jgi:hypothetical protein
MNMTNLLGEQEVVGGDSESKSAPNAALGVEIDAKRKGFSWRKRLRYRSGETLFRTPIIWWRHRGLLHSDVFLATYPRSGYTWLRFLLFDAITGKRSEFQEVNVAMPYVARHRQAWPMLPQGGRIIATHETYRREYKRAIYMVRDVRDVAVSEYLRERAKGLVGNVDDYLGDFLEGRKRHGSWARHLSSWLDSETARKGDLLVLRYEDLHTRPLEILQKATAFLGLKVLSSSIQRAIEDNTIERMRVKEDVSGVTFQGGGEDGRFVRKGSIGGWRDRLTRDQILRIEAHAGAALERMGYRLEG